MAWFIDHGLFHYHGLFHRPWLASALRQARLIFARFACRQLVMLNMSLGVLCNSDWQNLLTSRRQAARSCSSPCPSAQPIPKMNAQRATGINGLFRTAISTISLRDRPSSGLNSRSATVFLNLVGGVSFFQSRRRPEMSVPDPKQTSNGSLTHPRTRAAIHAG